MSNYLQDAYNESCATTDYNPDREAINALLDAGMFVIVYEHIAYCPITDATLRRPITRLAQHVPHTFTTLADATAAVTVLNSDDEHDPESYYTVIIPPSVKAQGGTWADVAAMYRNVTKADDEDMPF